MISRYRKDYSQDEQELEELTKDKNEQEEDVPSNEPEEGNFKKRYGDLRRHSQKKETDLQKEIDRLQGELAKANSSKNYPKTEEELKQWIERYPDLDGIIRTIVLKTTEESGSGGADRIRELEERLARSDIDRQKELAIKEILRVHPDFNELIDDTTEKGEKFHAWVEKQSGWVQFALYENETDAQAAIDAVDLYKQRNKGSDKKEREKAASGVRSKPTEAPRGEREIKYSESQVEAMSQNEFEKHYEKIQEAMRDGTFEYDISGQE